MLLARALVLACLSAAPAERLPADAPLSPPIDDRTGELGLQDTARIAPQLELLSVSRKLEAAALVADDPALEKRCRLAATAWRTGKIGDWALVCLSPKSRAAFLEIGGGAALADFPAERVDFVLKRALRRLAAGNSTDAISSVLDDLFSPPHVPGYDGRLAGLLLGVLPFLFGFAAAMGWGRLLESSDEDASRPRARATQIALVLWSLAGAVLVGLSMEEVYPGTLFDFLVIGLFLQIPGALGGIVQRLGRPAGSKPSRRRLLATAGAFVLGAAPPAALTFASEPGWNKLLVVTVLSALLAPLVSFALAGRPSRKGA